MLASSNSHKARELSRYLSPPLTIQTAPQALSVTEDGESFEENAFKKASAYFDHFQHPTVSDDSGLIVEALPGELGIHSARFGGEGLDNFQRSQKLLEKLKDESNRRAFFVCYLCFYLSHEEVFFFEGRLQGTIAKEYCGDHGFGYDPIFIPQKNSTTLTLAQQPEWKDKHSHRSQACKTARAFFESLARTCKL